MELIGFLIWMASIVICGVICDSKGRTVWKGLLAGFLVGWIGVIICACLDSHKE